MTSLVDVLKENAEREIEGERANEEIWSLRSELEREYGRAVLYELVLDPAQSAPEFLESMLPRFSEHMQAKGLPLLGNSSVLVCVWMGARASLFRAPAFFAAISSATSLTEEDLKTRATGLRKSLDPSN